MRKIFSLIVVVVLTITLVACKKEQAFDFERGYIVIGLEADYEPFNWLETKANDYNAPLEGQPGMFVAGYDVDVARFIGKELGLEVKFKQIEWLSLIPALNSGEIDLIIAGMSPTDVRKRTIAFSNYYYMSNHVILLDQNNAFANSLSLEDLAGSKGIGQSGTVYASIVDFLGKNFDVTVLPTAESIPEIVQALNGKAADFTVVEEPVADTIISENSNFIKILPSSSVENIYNVSEADREISIGLRKVDTVLLEKLNSVLSLATQEMRDAWMDEAQARSN